jgi:hypothetical protein
MIQQAVKSQVAARALLQGAEDPKGAGADRSLQDGGGAVGEPSGAGTTAIPHPKMPALGPQPSARAAAQRVR